MSNVRVAMFLDRNEVLFFKCIFIISYLLRTSSSVKIDKLTVPEVTQAGNSSGVVLDCQYSGVSDQFVIQWLYNGSEVPVYQWSPRTRPQVRGILEERLDLNYIVSSLPTEERRALRIVSLEPELSGEYTCKVIDQGTEARQTKTMIVFSPERDFMLQLLKKDHNIEIKCTARGLFPTPELILENNGMIISKQQLRTWRSEGPLFDAESTANLTVSKAGHVKPEQITCRLQLPQAGYTAIKKEMVYIGEDCSSKSSRVGIPASAICWILLTIFTLSTCFTTL